MAQLEAKKNPIFRVDRSSHSQLSKMGEWDDAGTARNARRERLILKLGVKRLFRGPKNVVGQNVSRLKSTSHG